MTKPKIILFSYDFYPSHSVSSLRTSYWAKNLKKYISKDISIEVITANSKAVKCHGIDSLTIIKPHWLSLLKVLKAYKYPHTIIISAGPFSFLLPIFFYSNNHKTIIDLRDPFAKDPKFKISKVKYLLKSLFQKFFISFADAIITINENLEKDYKIPIKKRTIIIPNGFNNEGFNNEGFNNEGFNPSFNIVNQTVIFGKVYEDISKLLDELNNILPNFQVRQYVDTPKINLTNIITTNKYSQIVPSVSPHLVSETLKQYRIGIVSSYPKNYVLPVKIFDYLAANLKIIVCSDVYENSELKKVLSSYPNVFYIKDINKINQTQLKSFLDAPTLPFDIKQIPSLYFREHSTKKLAIFLEAFI